MQNIDIVETFFLKSKGGLKLLRLFMDKNPGVNILNSYGGIPFRVVKLILRELALHKIKDRNVLYLSALGAVFPVKHTSYLYFQNIFLLESKTIKARIFRSYLKIYQRRVNCFVIVQSNWIVEKYSIFVKEKVRLYPLNHSYGKPCKYYFYPTNNQPYKNNSMVLSCFTKLSERFRLYITLDQEDYVQFKDNTNIVFLGQLNEVLLPLLYENASAVILASDYESYSYPLYEAMDFNKIIIAKDSDYLIRDYEKLLIFTDEDDLQLNITNVEANGL